MKENSSDIKNQNIQENTLYPDGTGDGIYMSTEMQEMLGYAGMGLIFFADDQFQIGRMTAGRVTVRSGMQQTSYRAWCEKAVRLLVPPDERGAFLRNAAPENIQKKLQEENQYSFKLHCYADEKNESLYRFSYYRLSDRGGWVLFTLKDCAEDIEKDALTGLYNRRGFVYYTSQILKESRDAEEFAVYFFNICNFKAFNEQYAVDIGDRILKNTARRLTQSFLKPLLTARIQASDSFLCLVRQDSFDEKQLCSLCQESYQIDDKIYTVYLRCGICRVEDKNEKVSGFCDRAKLAADTVHDEFNRPFSLFSKNMKDSYIAQTDVTGGLSNALKNEEFCVYYQPVVDVRTGEIASAEALIRWNSPKKGILSPALFVPVLEQNGHILQLDLFVAETVKGLMKARKDAGKRIVPVSINLSRMDFQSREGIDTFLAYIRFMAENELYPRIEITESAYTSMEENAIGVLERMKKNGAIILLDDFGTGYSSFSTLSEYDFDILKLDMGFVQKISNDKVDHIISAIIRMAHDIGAKVIAEGAETQSQVDFLRENDCDYIQGFYFAKPLPQEEFERMLDLDGSLRNEE